MLNQARNVMHATLGEFNDVGHDKKVLQRFDDGVTIAAAERSIWVFIGMKLKLYLLSE